MNKQYIVRNGGSWNNIFLVKANNKKEAIDKVFKNHFVQDNKEAVEKGYSPYTKSCFWAEKLEDAEVVNIN